MGPILVSNYGPMTPKPLLEVIREVQSPKELVGEPKNPTIFLGTSDR